MPLGEESKRKLLTCHPLLRRFVEAVAAGVDAGECPDVADITVLCGFRSKSEQEAAYARGTSKVPWPNSKHNVRPYARAVDIAPYPTDWSGKGLKSFVSLRRYALKVADDKGIEIHTISWDWPHYQLDPIGGHADI